MRFLIVFILCSAFVFVAGSLDWYSGGAVLRQAWSLTYPAATGVVTHSAVASEPTEDGEAQLYAPDVRYTYDVDGRSYQGDLVRFSGFGGVSQRSWVEPEVLAHPAGSTATVRYDPLHPETAVLSAGLNANDLFLLMILVPFNAGAILLTYLLWAASPFAQKQRAYDDHGMDMIALGPVTRVRMTFYRPIVTGVVTLMFAVFAGLGLAVWYGSVATPTLSLMLLDWALVLGSSFWAFWHQWRKQERGDADLVVNTLKKTIELPAHFGRKERETWAFAEIVDVDVETIERRGSRGSRTWTDEIRLRRKDGRRELIEELGDRDRADAFARWLRAKLATA